MAMDINTNAPRVELTNEDKIIFARIWMRGQTSPIAMIEGNNEDAQIMDLLACAAAENDGGRTTSRDYAYIEECSYVFWAEQVSASYEFDPII